jgi:hypothetical protein
LLDVIMIDGWTVVCLSHNGAFKWSYTIPAFGQSFRGTALSDLNNDDTLDVVFGTSKGEVIALHGPDGSQLWSLDLEAHYGDTFDIDHGPLVADFDRNGTQDVFVVGGHTKYPDIENNYGRAYAISVGPARGPDWLMFRRDIHRQACVCPDTGASTGIFDQTVSRQSLKVFPNPMHQRSTFNIRLDQGADLQLAVYDLQGKMVQELVSAWHPAGQHQFVFNRTSVQEGLPTGLYLVVAKTNGQRVSASRMVVE